jgi:hypothetical protein
LPASERTVPAGLRPGGHRRRALPSCPYGACAGPALRSRTRRVGALPR